MASFLGFHSPHVRNAALPCAEAISPGVGPMVRLELLSGWRGGKALQRRLTSQTFMSAHRVVESAQRATRCAVSS